MSDYIKGYALALFSLAQEEKKLQQVKDNALISIKALEQEIDFIHLLKSKTLQFKNKEQAILESFNGINNNIKNFMLITASKGNANIIIPVLKKLVKYINESLNIKEGVVYSTIKLLSKQIKEIETRVSKQLGFKPTLINKIDHELISGFKVVVEDKIIEDSIISRLEQIKYELLREEH